MELTLLDKLSGTLANAATVALGTGLGLVLRGRLPERMARIMVQGVGLTTLFIGLSMAQALDRRALCYTVEEFLSSFQEA